MVLEEGRKEEEEGEEKERLLEGMAVLDFDMLCSSVALQTANGTWGKLGGTSFGDDEQRSEEFGGVLRMW
ncbi:PLAC8 family protein, partial [Trifolium medium]|nr:PLAC8 family protein [Trifolium medium]